MNTRQRQQPKVKHRTGAGARINADNIWVYRIVVLLVIAAGTSGIIMSWQGLLHVAPWMLLPPALHWVVPVSLDVPIATLALASLAMRSRGRNGVARWFTSLALVFTALVGSAQFVYIATETGLLTAQDWTGAIGKTLAPGITLVMTEVLGLLVMRPRPEPRRKKPVRRAARKTPTTTPTAPLAPVWQYPTTDTEGNAS